MNKSQKRNREVGFRILTINNEKVKITRQQVKLNAYLNMMGTVDDSENKETAILDYITKRLTEVDKLGIEANHLVKIKEAILLERI